MELNFLGVVSALAAFLSIWGGHVAVRQLESKTVQLWKPMLLTFFLGTSYLVVAAWTESVYISAVCGIVSVTLLCACKSKQSTSCEDSGRV